MISCAISLRTRIHAVIGLLLTYLALQTVHAQSSSTTPAEVVISRWDQFLSIPPEYAALIGLGICFILLFIVVIIIICVTGRGRKLWSAKKELNWTPFLSALNIVYKRSGRVTDWMGLIDYNMTTLRLLEIQSHLMHSRACIHLHITSLIRETAPI